jgi:transposase
MARAYSLDLRERVVAAVNSGQTCRSVAETYEVSVSSVVKWSQRFQSTGSPAPGKIGGHRRALLVDHRDFILAQIAAEPHITLRRLQSALIERGIAVSFGTLWNFVRREGLSFKKKPAAKRAGSA